jgi:hypothetical protein
MSEAVATTPTMGAAPRSRARTAALAVLLSLPLVGLVVLLAAPELELKGKSQPVEAFSLISV